MMNTHWRLLLEPDTRFECNKALGGLRVNVYAKRNNQNSIILRLGSIDTSVPLKEIAHIWMSESAQWYDLAEELPQHDESLPL